MTLSGVNKLSKNTYICALVLLIYEDYKSIYLALKYFFEVERNSVEKSHGSIGIIPYVWNRASAYYERQANKIDNITTLIEKQLEQDRISIKINPQDYFGKKKKKIKPIDLSTLEE